MPATSSTQVVLTSDGFDLRDWLAFANLPTSGMIGSDSPADATNGAYTFAAPDGTSVTFSYSFDSGTLAVSQFFLSFGAAPPMFAAALDQPHDTGLADFASITALIDIVPLLPISSFTGYVGDDTAIATAAINAFNMGAGMDKVVGGVSDDLAYTGAGDDLADMGAGADKVFGGKGNDVLLSGEGTDTVAGAQGNDILVLGGGRNSVTGGPGEDVFVIDASASGRSVIRDFDPLSDTLVFVGVQSQIAPTPSGVGGNMDALGQGDMRGGFNVLDLGSGHLRITWGDHSAIIQNTTAAEISQNQFFWNSNDAATALDNYLFSGELAESFNGVLQGSSSGGIFGLENTAAGTFIDSYSPFPDLIIA